MDFLIPTKCGGNEVFMLLGVVTSHFISYVVAECRFVIPTKFGGNLLSAFSDVFVLCAAVWF
jgi:hypothetical protein